MSSQTFPNGDTLVSSALTPDAILAVFQGIVAQVLGFDITDPLQQSAAYSAVRIAWQTEGQPAWTIGTDVCSLEAYPENEPYSKVRDGFYTPNNEISVTEQMGYTQVWKIRFVFRGPNAADHARLLVSSMSLDFVHDALAESNVYAVAEKNRPVYVPELFQGQWWKRSDVELQFNELVSESLTVPSAAEADVTLIKDTGLTAGVTMTVPQ